MQRRDFIKLCGSTAVLATTGTIATPDGFAIEGMSAAKLIDKHGNPVKVARLRKDDNYIFHYPYQATPCMLLMLSKQVKNEVVLKDDSGTSYTWPGGTGPDGNIVAYSAICTRAATS